jgi:hypothetical protein
VTQERFVQLLATLARDAALKNVVEILASPPGRRPQPSVVEVSRWFNQLPAEGRSSLRRVMSTVAHTSLRAVLEVLDGAMPSDAQQPGHFVLDYIDPAGARSILAGPSKAPLGGLLASPMDVCQ